MTRTVARKLGGYSPALRRPQVDTLNGSKQANMTELRFRSNGGVWRVAFAFDPKRNAVMLVAGDKSGVSEKRFHASLIASADVRYDVRGGRGATEYETDIRNGRLHGKPR
ncbi:type II toxin-antitoxin system RelE/ParE family toxin [Azospirillum sp. TSH100]|uniref:type II toxin-antitoxin system RelE/ParE family toxin n=1 Tax=Azospirillum sp. TSH100 TaxID=652764 RepID=UPI001FFF453F|nr:type II toxin-antitoxin system RelE/ParE family toxin [Azospirillum sp. TSH100]